MSALTALFTWLMDACHSICPNWWVDIVLFTALTKILQFPVSLWCQANSVKMVSLMPQTNRIRLDHFGDADAIGDLTAALFKKEKYHPLLSLVPLAIQIVILIAFVRVIGNIAAAQEGSTLGSIPVRDGGATWLMPVLAGLSATVLGWAQNRINPLQREQGRATQMSTNGISIAISLFLGAFVAMGVGLYWAASNLLSILVQATCNLCIDPRRRVDYPALRASQAELKKLEDSLASAKKVAPEDRRREREDYRRFFKVANKHLVFYAESGGFYRYFASIIEWLLAHTNVVVHYITNDPKDGIFERAASNPRLKPYYIGPMKLIPLMMKMDADMVVMTTPDLNTFQIKRSYVRKDVEYIYLDHAPASVQMTYRKGAFDHFDTIFANGQYQIDEHRATERIYGLKPKKMVPTGYPLLDQLFATAAGLPPRATDGQIRILVAPSHQEGNLFEKLLEPLLSRLRGPGRKLFLRPHPQYTRRFPAKMQAIADRWGKERDITVETDFRSNTSLFEADILVTDWSGIAYEYAFVRKRPVIFVNTPMKIVNPEWERIGITPTNITFRDMAGVSVNPDELDHIPLIIDDILANPDKFRAKIDTMLADFFFNPGHAGEAAGRYILETLKNKRKKQ